MSFRTLTKFRRFDPFGFIPSWHFFAPNPARFDTVILVRRLSKIDNVAGSDWEIARVAYDERWHQKLFNPQRRIQKAIHDLQNAIGNMSDHHEPEKICKSAPALALFRYAYGKNSKYTEGQYLQFSIVRLINTRSNPEGRIVFISPPMKI